MSTDTPFSEFFMRLTDIMIDIETLGTTESSVVLSIGAVAFNRRNPAIPISTLYLGFGTSDCRKEQVEKGRTMSRDTIAWWNKQTPDAQRVLKEKNVENVTEALSALVSFIRGLPIDPLVWGNGSDFDNVIVGSLLETYGFARPWKFWNNRCFRTMKGEHGHIVTGPERVGVHHNALDDAIYQATFLQSIYSVLQKRMK